MSFWWQLIWVRFKIAMNCRAKICPVSIWEGWKVLVACSLAGVVSPWIDTEPESEPEWSRVKWFYWYSHGIVASWLLKLSTPCSNCIKQIVDLFAVLQGFALGHNAKILVGCDSKVEFQDWNLSLSLSTNINECSINIQVNYRGTF